MKKLQLESEAEERRQQLKVEDRRAKEADMDAQRRHELEMKRLEMEFGKGAPAAVRAKGELNERVKLMKLFVFQDVNDELDRYLQRFKRFAITNHNGRVIDREGA